MAYSNDTFAYLADLSANNSKDWFETNRHRYDTLVKAPSLDVIADLSEAMSKLSPSLAAEPRLNGSFRRLNRDTRFSKDKTPYSPRIHLVFWNGDHPNRSPGMHFVLHSDGVGLGAGQWAIEPARLKTLRDRILAEEGGTALEAALTSASKAGCEMGEPHLARIPRGYNADHPRAHLLRYKGFVVRTQDQRFPMETLTGAGWKTWMMEKTEALLPLIRWLAD